MTGAEYRAKVADDLAHGKAYARAEWAAIDGLSDEVIEAVISGRTDDAERMLT